MRRPGTQCINLPDSFFILKLIPDFKELVTHSHLSG